jgi:hypothetical protein
VLSTPSARALRPRLSASPNTVEAVRQRSRGSRAPGSSFLDNGDAQRTNPGHIRLLQGIESDNHRSEGRKHLGPSRYSSCHWDVSGDLCVPITSSTSCDQPIFVDHATYVSVFSNAVQVEIDWLG